MQIAELIDALSQSAAYPHAVGHVEARQTHISVVFLAGPFVYKIKKPITLPFLDFSTIEKRRHFCEEEVRLNRRLAPDVYLGVVPIVQTPGAVHVEHQGASAAVVEWAVKMRRLPDRATLHEWLIRDEVDAGSIEALARRIASFHRLAEADSRTQAFGAFDAVSRTILDIFDEAVSSAGAIIAAAVFDRVNALVQQSLGRLRPMIESRAERGLTRDCHGDLHLDHVYFFPDRPPPADLVIVDCIEFNEQLRCIDPIADMAFAAMDLKFHGRHDLAAAYSEAYLLASGDEEGRALIPLYTAYRATVRALVDWIKLSEQETSARDRDEARTRAKAHWLLALTELETPRRKPCLILVMGLPGTGKSTLARLLGETGNFQVIRSDVVRNELAAHAPGEAIYSADWNRQTYDECMHRAQEVVEQGQRVIVDATFREEKKRGMFLEAARRWGVPGYAIECRAEPQTARLRLQQRKEDASQADWTVYQQLLHEWEQPAAATQRVLYHISNEGTPEMAVAKALAVLHIVDLW